MGQREETGADPAQPSQWLFWPDPEFHPAGRLVEVMPSLCAGCGLGLGRRPTGLPDVRERVEVRYAHRLRSHLVWTRALEDGRRA
ncbi:hypothetical protein ABZ667_32580 [Streptomyces lavendulae]|uniref:hypothetical protein n=1 Tax=Streptomyces lavendulae TaxID=1914 RepID=UPI0033D21615